MKTLASLSLALAALGLSAADGRAAFTVYSGLAAQPAFDAAAGPLTTENFADATLVPGLSFTSGSGGTIGGGTFNDIVARGGPNTTFTFGTPATAFGGFTPASRPGGQEWNLSPGGAGQGIEFVVTLVGGGTQVVPAEVPNTFIGQFFGFISDIPFTAVTLNGGTQGGAQETYSLDNLVFNVAAPAATATPAPAAAGLLAVGAGLLTLVRRRLS